MIIYKIVIFLVISLGFIYLFKYHMTKIEYFEDGNNAGLSVSEIAGSAIASAANKTQLASTSANSSVGTPEEIAVKQVSPECKSGNWWDEKPIKAIRSKLWGASYNLVFQPEGNINTPVLVPINNPNSQAPPGCLSVTQTGWHESAMCADKNVDQRWQIKKISSQQDFETAMSAAQQEGATTGFTYGYKMDKVDYPFFIVVSKDYQSQALYYNGSALGVRPIGNYDDQKWDILSHEIKDPIVTHDFNYYSKLTPEMQPIGSQTAGSQISGFQDLSSNPQALAALLQSIIKPPNTGGAFGVEGPLKINVEMDDAIISQFVNPSSNNNNTTSNNATSNTITEPFENQSADVYYPKKPMNIDVTLNYAMSMANQTSEQTATDINGTETIDINEVDAEGNLIKVGETKMSKQNGETKTTKEGTQQTCNDTKCHPDMTEWITKPYPCRACVPNNSEAW
jgi:hypothetical protein